MNGEATKRGLVSLTDLIKGFITPYREEIRNKKMPNIKEVIDDMSGSTRYIKFSGDYDKFDEWKF